MSLDFRKLNGSMYKNLLLKSYDWQSINGRPPTILFLSCNLISLLVDEVDDLHPFSNLIPMSKEYVLHIEKFDCHFMGMKIVRIMEDNFIAYQ